MKSFSRKAHVLSIICLGTSLSLSALTMPVMANSLNQVAQSTEVPQNAERPVPPKEGDKPHAPHRNGDCKCHRPFRRFTAAMDSLKQEQLISSGDIKKIYDALMKIPPETLDKATDKDQSVADALYKDKVLTEEQYNKICIFLKANPPRKP